MFWTNRISSKVATKNFKEKKMMGIKQWYQSKRFWAGIIALITSLSFLFTGEKTIEEVLPELTMTAFIVIQCIIALISGKQIAFGSKNLFGKSLEQ